MTAKEKREGIMGLYAKFNMEPHDTCGKRVLKWETHVGSEYLGKHRGEWYTAISLWLYHIYPEIEEMEVWDIVEAVMAELIDKLERGGSEPITVQLFDLEIGVIEKDYYFRSYGLSREFLRELVHRLGDNSHEYLLYRLKEMYD